LFSSTPTPQKRSIHDEIQDLLSKGYDLKELEESDEFYQALIKGFQKRGLHKREVFLATDLEQFETKPAHELFAFIIDSYRELLFFPDEEIITRFEEIGIKRRLLTTFISLDKIVEQIDYITADGEVKMPKGVVLFLIKVFLDTQAAYDNAHIAEFTTMLNGRLTSKTELAFYNAYRRRNYSGGAPLHNKMSDHVFDQFIEQAEAVTQNKEEARKLILQFSSGNTDTFFLKGIRQLSTFKLTNSNKRRFFGLFKLLSFRHSFLSKQDYDMLPRYYGRSYSTYQARRFDQVTR
jgi:hypothetical protein